MECEFKDCLSKDGVLDSVGAVLTRDRSYTPFKEEIECSAPRLVTGCQKCMRKWVWQGECKVCKKMMWDNGFLMYEGVPVGVEVCGMCMGEDFIMGVFRRERDLYYKTVGGALRKSEELIRDYEIDEGASDMQVAVDFGYGVEVGLPRHGCLNLKTLEENEYGVCEALAGVFGEELEEEARKSY